MLPSPRLWFGIYGICEAGIDTRRVAVVCCWRYSIGQFYRICGSMGKCGHQFRIFWEGEPIGCCHVSGQTPKCAVVHCHQGPLTVAGFLAPLVASFASGVEQNMCDFPPICVWFSWSFSHGLWRRNKSNSLLPLRDLETVQRLVFYSQKKKKKKKKSSLRFFLKLFCELLRNRGVGDLISSLGKKKFSLPWWRRRRRRRRVFFSI